MHLFWGDQRVATWYALLKCTVACHPASRLDRVRLMKIARCYGFKKTVDSSVWLRLRATETRGAAQIRHWFTSWKGCLTVVIILTLCGRYGAKQLSPNLQRTQADTFYLASEPALKNRIITFVSQTSKHMLNMTRLSKLTITCPHPDPFL